MTRRGFTLVEILVALVVVQVGLTAVVGTLVLAARVLREARVLEEGVAGMEAVYDSLRSCGGGGEGEREVGGGVVAWRGGTGGSLVVEYRLGEDVVAVVHGRGEELR